jgi:hypothetical protein
MLRYIFKYGDPDWQVTSYETVQKAQTIFQTPSPWWQSRLPLQWHWFNKSTPPKWLAALHMYVPRQPLNGLAVIDKLKQLLAYFYQHL